MSVKFATEIQSGIPTVINIFFPMMFKSDVNSRMKGLVLAVLSAIVALSTAEQYTDRYDDFDFDEVLANRRLLNPYVKCILDKGRCTPEGKELKGKYYCAGWKSFVCF